MTDKNDAMLAIYVGEIEHEFGNMRHIGCLLFKSLAGYRDYIAKSQADRETELAANKGRTPESYINMGTPHVAEVRGSLLKSLETSESGFISINEHIEGDSIRIGELDILRD